MTMADVLRIFLLIVGTLLIFISYWLATEALFPELVERCREKYSRHVLRTSVVGLALAFPLILIGILFLSRSPNPVGKLVGWAFISGPVFLGLAGSTGLSRRIGMGLPSAVDERQPWRPVLRGGIVLSFTFLLPFAGWFLVLPWTLISGFGAAVGSLVFKPRPSSPVPGLPEANQVPG
jgi:hypothetical protein